VEPNILQILTWAAQQETEGAPGKPSGSPMLFMFVALFFLAYFLLIRPQKQERQRRQQMVDSLAKGDSVITAGGIHGTVESVDKEKGIVTLNVAPKINMKFNRTAVSSIVKKKGKPQEDAEQPGRKR
jgi:preprotein translocase subunit YajC